MTTRYYLAILRAVYFAGTPRPRAAQQPQERFNMTKCGAPSFDYHLPTSSVQKKRLVGCLRRADRTKIGVHGSGTASVRGFPTATMILPLVASPSFASPSLTGAWAGLTSDSGIALGRGYRNAYIMPNLVDRHSSCTAEHQDQSTRPI